MSSDASEENLHFSSWQMKNANNYTDWTFSLFRHILKGDVLEIGCGIGSFTKLISKEKSVHSLKAIDISADAIRYLNRFTWPTHVKFDHCDAVKDDGQYDTIICLNVMEHVEDDKKFLQQVFSLLKQNGKLVLLVPAHQFLYTNFDKAAGHFKRYNKKDFKTMPGTISLIDRYYFNPIGAIGYYLVYKILNKVPTKPIAFELSFFDKVIVPISRIVFPKKMFFGISIITIWNKQ
jgi:SAM-dependent methyltransferase